MPTDTDTLFDQLTDPTPPVPGDEARAAVHARATTLVRRRRFAQGGTAIACAAVIAIGAVAIASSGTTARNGQVATASQPSDVTASTPPAVSTAPAVADTTPAPTVAPEPSPAVADPAPIENAAPAVDPGPPAPAEAAVASATVSVGSVPDNVNLTVTLVGDGGTYTSTIRTPGVASFDGIPPGDYELRWSWSSDDGTATAVGRSNVTLGAGANSFSA